MALVNGMDWLKRAQAEGYAVGAFNANTLEQMQAITLAAEDERAPVTIQISHNAARYIGAGDGLAGMRYAVEMGRTAAAQVDVPVTLHFDHGSPEDILLALELGFTSVMFDGSHLPFEENIARARDLCAAAHEAGACFEAELGDVPRAGAPGMEQSELTVPQQAAEYVARTGVDALAVAIGSVHAMTHKRAVLDFARLDSIRALVNVPLVLHGSSGVLDENIREGIRRGLCKVNVATQLNAAFTRAVRDYLRDYEEEVDPRKYLARAREAMREQVRERMRLFGVSHKAGPG